jgi:exo-1,4-beta-D-glucosaminidase
MLIIHIKSFIVYLLIVGLSLFYPFLLSAQTIPSTIMLQDNWQVISSQAIEEENQRKISMPGYDVSSWYHSVVPSTVLNVFVQNGIYQHILDGLILKNIAQEPFDVPWWYRTSFNLESVASNTQLDLNGINYSADIWLNGKQIATKDFIYGMFKRYQLDMTPYLKKGNNVLAIKVYPPKAEDFRLGFTDWNPNPPDRNMGIYRDVSIRFNHGLEIKNPFVRTALNSPENNEAKLTLQLTAINHQAEAEHATIAIKIDNLIKFTKEVNLAPHEEKIITLTPKDEKKLIILHPKLWWPNHMGEPYLYQLTATINQGDKVSDLQTLHFGIRKIETSVVAYQEKNKQAQSYYRTFKINGQPVLIRGAAWTDSMLLNDTPQHVKDQLSYAKAMNLNAIRLEGFWGNDKTLYETCDKLGLLIMMGWSAQWEWPLHGFRKPEQCDRQHGCYTTAEDQALIVSSFKDQITWLRNSPSIFVWLLGSDLKPLPELESKLASLIKTLNPDVPYVISAAETLSAWNNQPSGIKMRGPYIYVPPVYWFENHTDGGAFGFNSETGPGAEVPPLESLKRLLVNPQDYWPNTNPVWVYHQGDHPKLQTLSRYDEAMAARYGAPWVFLPIVNTHYRLTVNSDSRLIVNTYSCLIVNTFT